MAEEIDVRMGEMAVGSGNTLIRTGGVGSCVVVIIFDEIAKVGGLAHSMLPTRKKGKTVSSLPAPDDDSVAKYADEAVERLVTEVEKVGGKRVFMEARLVGGSHMFKSVADDADGIGNRNVEEARSALSRLGITIHNEEVGGSVGRLVEFSLANGLVSVMTKM